MFHAMVRFILIFFRSCGCLQEGVIISGLIVQVKIAPRHRSTHISNYQSNKRESTKQTTISMCPQERFALYKRTFRLALCYKKDWATFLHLCYYFYLLLVTNYLATQLSIIVTFNTCTEHLVENRLSFPYTPRWVRHSYLSKRLR